MKIVIQLCAELNNQQQALIKSLPYDCVIGNDALIADTYSHILRCDQQGLSLLSNSADSGGAPAAPTQVNFLAGDLRHRRLTSGKSQGIAKAVGLNKMEAPSIVDATAGLGKDSFILASLGCSVTLLERSPLIHALLDDGFKRGFESADGDVHTALNRMTLVNQDASVWFARVLAGELEKPDVIYLDPMFPPRTKSALVKKDILLLQQVLEVDEGFEELLLAAQACARHRVVVKRPGKKSKNSVLKPSFQIEGKSAHFDVFV